MIGEEKKRLGIVGGFRRDDRYDSMGRNEKD